MKLKSISHENFLKEKDQSFCESYVGKIQGFHKLIDVDEIGTQSIWSFQVIPQRADTSQLPVLNVEMKGQNFEGSLHDGDQVRLPTGPLGEGMIRVSKLENLTDHTQVIAYGNSYSDYLALGTIFGVLITVIIGLFILSDIIFLS